MYVFICNSIGLALLQYKYDYYFLNMINLNLKISRTNSGE